jgi:hypothetical protein
VSLKVVSTIEDFAMKLGSTIFANAVIKFKFLDDEFNVLHDEFYQDDSFAWFNEFNVATILTEGSSTVIFLSRFSLTRIALDYIVIDVDKSLGPRSFQSLVAVNLLLNLRF